MAKFGRSQRVAVLTGYLARHPGRLYNLGFFSEILDTAKSSISEDLVLVREVFRYMGWGEVITVAGASGGVKFVPSVSADRMRQILKELVRLLAKPERILPGGYLYMTDIIFDPGLAQRIGEAFATVFQHAAPQRVVTVETKGIPLALMTARTFDIPLVVIRDAGKVTEGSSVVINYVSGSQGTIRSMSLSRRALPPGSRVLIIDDFMKAGGTIRGMRELLKEFQAEVVGTGVLVATAEPARKLVEDYVALLRLEGVNPATGEVRISPFH